MKILNFNDKDFFHKLNFNLNKREGGVNINIDQRVKTIIEDVKNNGDTALIKYAKEFDKIDMSKNEIELKNLEKFYLQKDLNKEVVQSFKRAILNITNFHEKQLPQNYEINNNDLKLSSIWQPLDSVGLYIPGGSAVYPSSLIMSAIPAKVAGVKRIVCVTPPTNNINPYILKLLEEFEIKEVYFVGGAQAVAALSYGTETIKPVNKIFGPGNTYVASAKKQVFGKVGIDLIAGPSEIVVVASEENNKSWIASDLMAQAEHDENAQSILITNSEDFAFAVKKEIEKLSSNLSNKNTIKISLEKNGLIILMQDLNQSSEIINLIAPEHLHLQSKERYDILSKVRHAGGIFLGEYSSEAFGDYIVGTNHVLPTSGSAKFSSGLGVLDFMKRSSIVEMNKKSFEDYASDVEKMADVEGLDAHKLSVRIRQTKEN